ncbi:MAG TPA: tetrahydrofolate dehydrogenase/cyclohydrolase catalytic domain-containing protein, partial [Bacteroidales bacterium]
MQLIDGKIISEQIKAEIAKEVEEIKKKGGKIPHLAAILVGNDGASETYVAHKVKDCEQVGFKSTLIRFNASVSEEILINEIKRINEDRDIDGLIVQLPVPRHISENKIIEAIDPAKDVDGFHPINIGRMVIGLPAYVS